MKREIQPSLEIYEGANFRISAYSLENSLGHPYEDSFIVAPLIEIGEKSYLPLMIADGVTRVKGKDGSYPSPSPSKQLADIICQKTAEFLRERLMKDAGNIEGVCFEVLEQANREAFKFNQSWGLEGAELAGTTFTLALVKLEEEKVVVYWASIGDSPLIIFSPDGAILLNPDQLANFEENKNKLKKWLGKSGRDFSIWHRENLRNKHYQFEGVDLGYGALTGEEGAKDYFATGKAEIRKGDFLLVASDGVVEAGINILQEVIKDPRLTFEQKPPFIFGKVLNELLHNQNKRNDDMTGILLEI